MVHIPMTRRRFLAGLGASTLALPLLPSLSFSNNPMFPKRLIILFSANGTIYNQWRPDGSGRNFTMRRILEPLAPHKDDLLILDGLDNKVGGLGDAHQKGMANALTGARILAGDKFKGGGNAGKVGWGGGISVDQFLGNRLEGKTRFKTLEFGVQTRGPNIWSRMSYTGADKPVTPQDDPTKMFERLYGDPTEAQNAARMKRIRQLRKSSLDHARRDLELVKQRVSARERMRLEGHLASIRSIERRIQGEEGNAMMCEAPDMDTRIDFNANDNFPAVGKLQMDMLVNAMSCDMTRVATLQFSRSVSQTQFNWIGISDKHHDMSHKGDDDNATQEKLIKINRWYAEQMAYLVQKLKDHKEGDGTMLDNTVVVWVNELSKGNNHSRNNLPFVLAGNCGGFFKTGEYMQIDKPHNHLLVSICQAMGFMDVNEFGVSDFKGGLNEIRA